MKGAPECLFERCVTIATSGRDEPMTKDMKSLVEGASEGLADTGAYPNLGDGERC